MTDDTAFLGTDVRQADLGLDYTKAGGAARTYATSATAEFAYGFMENIDLMISAVWKGWSSRGISQSGLGDVALEAKFEAGRAGDWTVAMKPGFSLPEGDESKGLGAGKGGVWFYTLAGREAGPWGLYLNGGYLYNRNKLGEEKNILKGSGMVMLKVLPEFKAVVDLSGETNRTKGAVSHPFYSAFGIIWSPSAYLDMSAGLRLGVTRLADDSTLLGSLTFRI
jgi:hypothetical protein